MHICRCPFSPLSCRSLSLSKHGYISPISFENHAPNAFTKPFNGCRICTIITTRETKEGDGMTGITENRKKSRKLKPQT